MLSVTAARAHLCARALLASRGGLRSAVSFSSSSSPPLSPPLPPAHAPAQQIATPSSPCPSPVPLSPFTALSRQLAEIASAAPLSAPLAVELRTRVLHVLAAMHPPTSSTVSPPGASSSAFSSNLPPAPLSLPPIARDGGWDAFFAQLATDAAADAHLANNSGMDAAADAAKALELAALALVPRVRAVDARHRCALQCAERLVALQRPRAAARVLVAAAEAGAQVQVVAAVASGVSAATASAGAAGMTSGFAAAPISASGLPPPVLLRRPIVALALSLVSPLLASATCAADVHEVARLANALGFAWHRTGALLECGRRMLALAADDVSAGAGIRASNGTDTGTGTGTGSAHATAATADSSLGISPPQPSAAARVDAAASFACAHLPAAGADRAALLVGACEAHIGAGRLDRALHWLTAPDAFGGGGGGSSGVGGGLGGSAGGEFERQVQFLCSFLCWRTVFSGRIYAKQCLDSSYFFTPHN